MKVPVLALAAAALIMGAVGAQAEDSAKMNQSPGASESSPGHQMKEESGPGASEYAPGRQSENRPSGSSDTPDHQMQKNTGPGASEDAPGHNEGKK